MINIKFLILSANQTVSVSLSEDDPLIKGIDELPNYVPQGRKVILLFNGRILDQQQSIKDLGLQNDDTVQVVITQEQRQQNNQQTEQPRQAYDTPFRGGFERLLEAGVPREDIIKQRLIFLARTGYLSQEQLAIVYLNPQILQPTRGYTAPRPQLIRQTFVSLLRAKLQIDYDFSVPLKPTPEQVRILYPRQGNPEDQQLVNERVNQLSLILMFLEAGVPRSLEHFFNLIDFSFIDHNTPLPTIPLKAMQLEILWTNNNSNIQNLQQLTAQHDMFGPEPPVVPTTRVLSSFQRLLTMVTGALLGVLFNLVVFPFIFHESIPMELRTGMLLGCILNIACALFTELAGIV